MQSLPYLQAWKIFYLLTEPVTLSICPLFFNSCPYSFPRVKGGRPMVDSVATSCCEFSWSWPTNLSVWLWARNSQSPMGALMVCGARCRALLSSCLATPGSVSPCSDDMEKEFWGGYERHPYFKCGLILHTTANPPHAQIHSFLSSACT